jgi:hypothetical protein
MHTVNQGWTGKLLSSTAFEITQAVLDMGEEAGWSDVKVKKMIRLSRERWSDNFRTIKTKRDVTGLNFGNKLCKIPAVLMAEVAPGQQRARPSKLWAFEYKDLALVRETACVHQNFHVFIGLNVTDSRPS